MLHLGVDARTGQIVASALAAKDVDDASQAGPLLDQVAGPVASFTGNGAYDQDRIYAGVTQHHPDAGVVVPPRATAVPSEAATRPSWRMLHLGVDARTGQIVASALAAKDVDDASQAGPLLDQVAGPVASFTGNGAYDQDRIYAGVTQHHPDAGVVVPPRATAVPSEAAGSAPTQRDGHLQHIAWRGRMRWQSASGYNKRARVEATMNRWRQVIGDALRAHTDERRATEVAVAVHALNRMLELGRPSYVRVA